MQQACIIEKEIVIRERTRLQLITSSSTRTFVLSVVKQFNSMLLNNQFIFTYIKSNVILRTCFKIAITCIYASIPTRNMSTIQK